MSFGADLPGDFNPMAYTPSMGGGNALPISDKKGYMVVISESELRSTQNNDGQMLTLGLTIQDGVHAGSTGNWNLNIANKSEVTVRIAMQQLACICHAVGHFQPLTNTEVLHGKPFRVVVSAAKKDADKGYTEVTNIFRADGSKLTDPPGSGGAPSAPPPAPPAAPMMQQAAPQQPQQQMPAPTGFPTQAQQQPAPQGWQQAAPIPPLMQQPQPQQWQQPQQPQPPQPQPQQAPPNMPWRQ